MKYVYKEKDMIISALQKRNLQADTRRNLQADTRKAMQKHVTELMNSIGLMEEINNLSEIEMDCSDSSKYSAYTTTDVTFLENGRFKVYFAIGETEPCYVEFLTSAE
jgi:hypothetical protein